MRPQARSSGSGPPVWSTKRVAGGTVAGTWAGASMAWMRGRTPSMSAARCSRPVSPMTKKGAWGRAGSMASLTMISGPMPTGSPMVMARGAGAMVGASFMVIAESSIDGGTLHENRTAENRYGFSIQLIKSQLKSLPHSLSSMCPMCPMPPSSPMAPPTHMPPLSALRAFEATVRHGSVSKAARELHLTDGAVSRAVRDMEEALGFALFQRSNRSIIATPTARVLAEEVALALERLRGALGRARQAAGPDRPLVLSCEPTFLMRWLIPRLGGLQEAIGTQRELRLVSAGGSVPFAREGIDLAIRRADFDLGADVVAEPFLQEHV